MRNPCLNISEPFLESVPQVHILLAIINLDPAGNCSAIGTGSEHSSGLFFATLATSVLTASFGISKFLKSGPCHIIRNDGCWMGFGTLSYILLLINIIATLVGKGFIFPIYLDGPGSGGYITVIKIIALNFLPQFLHVSLHHF